MVLIHIEVEDVNKAIVDLLDLGEAATTASGISGMAPGGTFSAVSGLREAGEKHGAIYSEHAPLATDAFTIPAIESSAITVLSRQTFNTFADDFTFPVNASVASGACSE